MKVHSDWLVLCRRVIRDAETAQFTLVETIEHLSALTFPSMHHGFAITALHTRLEPADDTTVHFRLMRIEDDEEESMLQLSGKWSADSERLRVYQNFDHLVLRRPGVITFRLDHRFDDEEAWRPGPSSTVRVMKIEFDDDGRAELRRRFELAGLPVPAELA